MSKKPRNVVIMGAAGRDFHNFNVVFRDDPDHRVTAFTAFQIPNIDHRTYPKELAGPLYPAGIPIHPEAELAELIRRDAIDDVVFAYSDVAYEQVMRKSAIVQAAGANFRILGPSATMLPSKKPVISVCAVRTGCGKSQTSRAVADILKKQGKRVAVIRHPMPYGDLNAQRCQRFERLDDLARHHCTVEEREEYESHILAGSIVYAGVDYGDILRAAEAEADVILWDGGNNDWSFYRPDLPICLVDPHRPGHELRYFPGEVTFRTAKVVLIAKSNTAPAAGIAQVRESIAKHNPAAHVIQAGSVIKVADPASIRGKRVLVVEDGPTLTHGEMTYGAGAVAAKEHGAKELVDPRPYAVGTIKKTFETYSHLKDILPAMGYGDAQLAELRETINAVPCDLVLVGTPMDLGKVLGDVRHPMMRVTYDLDDSSYAELSRIIGAFLSKRG